MRVAAGLLILVICSAWGFRRSLLLKRRCTLLRELRLLVEQYSIEISCTAPTLAELAGNSGGEFGRLLCEWLRRRGGFPAAGTRAGAWDMPGGKPACAAEAVFRAVRQADIGGGKIGGAAGKNVPFRRSSCGAWRGGNAPLKERRAMELDLIFKIAAVGIIVAVLNQILKKTDHDEQAMMLTVAGLVIVLMMLIPAIDELFGTIRSVFGLW